MSVQLTPGTLYHPALNNVTIYEKHKQQKIRYRKELMNERREMYESY